MLRLEVEPGRAAKTRHMTSREAHGFNIIHWLSNTQTHRNLGMPSANTYPPVLETTGLLDSAQSFLLRLLVGLKFTA